MRVLTVTCQEHLVLKESKAQVFWASLEASEMSSGHTGTHYVQENHSGEQFL